ncbi:MAG: hypothetical protein ACM3SP_26655 [Chloroflexota bacterium]
MKDYLRAVIHALALLIHRREEALEIAAREPMRLMNVSDRAELRRQIDSIAEMLRVRPYPTVEAIVNSNEIAAHEYGSGVENPLTLWDLHWVKELDDAGFIDELLLQLSPKA